MTNTKLGALRSKLPQSSDFKYRLVHIQASVPNCRGFWGTIDYMLPVASSQVSPIDVKIQRLQSGAGLRMLDLFSGCGGLTTGFTRAGFTSVGGVENDPFAAASYARNFHPGPNEKHFGMARDIRELDLTELLGADEGMVASSVDVVIGGPPCPSFTRVGRAKLREVMAHPEAFKLDERTTLYLNAMRIVEQTQPLAVLLENVPDVLNQGGRSVGDEMAEYLQGLGYEVSYTLLNAANYGVPQTRDRFFLMAFAGELGSRPEFPKPTHWVDLPRGYKSSRDVALKLLGDLAAHPFYRPPAPASKELPAATTAYDALHDLPPVTEHLARGARRFDNPISTPAVTNMSNFASEMRTWPNFENSGTIADHVTRSLGERDLRLFAGMKPGDQYPEAHALATDFWIKAGAKEAELRSYVPPYDPSKFPNKWRKMEPDMPARTLMAHLGKDTYSHIHYDSAQARTITVREAARLQSFPDGFEFCGTMNPAFRQIGNAVAPLLAFRLAESMRSGIESALITRSDTLAS